MSDLKNLPPVYLQSCRSKLISQDPSIFPISCQSFTIGRSHENALQILDNTISKKHAKVALLNGDYFLEDLSSANGVFVNGTKVQGSVKLQNQDSIQFGKYACLYLFYNKSAVRAKSKGKEKINLKDYLFQDGTPANKNKTSAIDFMESAVTQPINQSKALAPSGLDRKKPKVKQSKIRIPDLSDYLKIAEGEDGPDENPTLLNNQDRPYEKFTRGGKKESSIKKQGRIKLQSLQQQDPTDEDLKEFKLDKRQRNIFLQEQEALQNIEKQKRLVEQQRLKKELQQAKIAEDLLQKQLLLEQKVRQQQEKVEAEKQKLEQEFVRRQKLKREEELANIKKLEEKQRQMMDKIEEERNRQIMQLKYKQEKIKVDSQNQYKQEYEKRRKQLQTEAEALARQYENIYRETIKKVRTQIDNQELTIQKMQNKEQELKTQVQDLEYEIANLQKQLNLSKNHFVKISGRNKACILYASDIQDKIDALGTKEARKQQSGFFQPNQATKSLNVKKIEESIMNSRKLLKIKEKQHENSIQQMNALSVGIKEKQYASSLEVSEFIDTIGENLVAIQRLKKQYLQMIECERTIQEAWEGELQENSELENKNRLLENEIAKNMREIDENSRDHIKKATEQRLHMLKLMHFCPEQKKRAAKFLIQEMLSIEQEIHQFRNNNEDIHKKIGKIIAKTESIKRQNQYLSEILFSQDENGHHFDNMKIVINNLVSKISDEKNVDNITDCLHLSDEAMKYQLMVQHQLERKKKLQESMRKISQMGLAAPQAKSNEKSPLAFFGDVLTAKQIGIEKTRNTIESLEGEINKVKSEIKIQQQKKEKISQTLQKYKAEQLGQAKRYLANK